MSCDDRNGETHQFGIFPISSTLVPAFPVVSCFWLCYDAARERNVTISGPKMDFIHCPLDASCPGGSRFRHGRLRKGLVTGEEKENSVQ